MWPILPEEVAQAFQNGQHFGRADHGDQASIIFLVKHPNFLKSMVFMFFFFGFIVFFGFLEFFFVFFCFLVFSRFLGGFPVLFAFRSSSLTV